MISESLVTTALTLIGIVGFAYIQRSFILMVMKETIKLLVKDGIDREKQQKSLIYEVQTVERSRTGDNSVSSTVKSIPLIDKVKEEIDNVKDDITMLLPHFNKNLEGFREEIEKLVEAANCPPELKEKCIEYFLEIKKVINGDIDEKNVSDIL